MNYKTENFSTIVNARLDGGGRHVVIELTDKYDEHEQTTLVLTSSEATELVGAIAALARDARTNMNVPATGDTVRDENGLLFDVVGKYASGRLALREHGSDIVSPHVHEHQLVIVKRAD